MKISRILAALALALFLPLFSAQALYGTVEFVDGRTLTGQIKPVEGQDSLGFFVPAEGLSRLIPLVEIQRIELNWHHNPSGRQPYFLQLPGDIRVTLLTGEVVEGAYFGSAPGARKLLVVLDNFEEVALVLNDTKREAGDCVRSIDFQTVHVPAPADAVPLGLKGESAPWVDYRVAAESAELLSAPGGKPIAKVRQGAGLQYLKQKGGFYKVRTVGLVEVEGWIARSKLTAERHVQPAP